MKVQNKNDLKTAYELLLMVDTLEDVEKEKLQKFKKNVKQNIRKFYKMQEEKAKTKLVHDNGIDGYTVLYPLPDFLKTLEEAKQYFEEEEYIHPTYSMYDCTGKPFTSGYKVFNRNGSFYVYHSISYDV